MAITPADIQAQTFSEAKRGYDPAEVDVFLETLSSEVDAMLAKIVDLKGRLTATEQQLADAQAQLAQAQDATAQAVPAAPVAAPAPDFSAQERQISAALIAAQQTAETIVNDANENAERIRNEADAKAREVIRQALTEKQAELEDESIVSRLPVRSSRPSILSSSSTSWTMPRTPSRPTSWPPHRSVLPLLLQ